MISSIVDIYVCLIVCFIAIFFAWHSSRTNKNLILSVTLALWFYHVLFIFIYINFLPGDWINYYSVSQMHQGGWFELFGMGTRAINFITYPFSNRLGLSVVPCFFIFSLFGYLGILNWYKIYSEYAGKRVSLKRVNLFPLILFFPNIHIWTVAIGKDTLVFYAISIMIFSLLNIKRRVLPLILSLVLISYIRIHISMIILVSMAITTIIFNRQIRIIWKFVVGSFLVVILYLLTPMLLSFIGVPDLTLDSAFTYLNELQSFRTDASTHVNLSELPITLKVLTYLFRPLFFDAPNISLGVLSIENFIWLLLAISLMHRKFYSWFRSQNFVLQFSFVFLIFGAYILSHGLSNFGLIMRQKMMLIPCLGLVSIGFLSYLKTAKT